MATGSPTSIWPQSSCAASVLSGRWASGPEIDADSEVLVLGLRECLGGALGILQVAAQVGEPMRAQRRAGRLQRVRGPAQPRGLPCGQLERSEERRVGKECR